MRPGRFRHFAAIDWSGAAGERHHGIAVAICQTGRGAPELLRPGHRWSREEVLDWLVAGLPADCLIGFDMGTSLAFADAGAFFPGLAHGPADARQLWALVDRICDAEPHLGVGPFVDHSVYSRYFRRHRGREGDRFGGGSGRLRLTERAQALLGCNPCSNFNLVGPAQVGKASLAGMRLLHRLGGRVPVWPFDPLPASGAVVIEIYTAIAAIAGGRRAGRSKMRSHADLNHALAALGSAPVIGAGPVSDHASDALLAAAWLRGAAGDRALWHPPALTPALAATEGWTFGAR